VNCAKSGRNDLSKKVGVLSIKSINIETKRKETLVNLNKWQEEESD
jgi:hypothetical protein